MRTLSSFVWVVALFFFWTTWLLSIPIASQEHCRVLDFRDVFRDKAFNKSIIKNVTVKDDQLCQLRCFVEETCKSYNLGPAQSGGEGKRVCELSSSHHVLHPDHLVSKPGFVYRPSTNLCGLPCPEKQSCYPVGNKGFSCLCPKPGVTENTCTEVSDIDECTANTHDCAAEADCHNTEGSFTCTCRAGYIGNGTFCQLEAFPFRWKLDGTDNLLRLSGAATFTVAEGGITVLYLDGSPLTYAETPAIPILTTDFTISVWIKMIKLPRSHQPIYGDWSSNPSFAFAVSANGELCAIAKRRPPATDHVFLICKDVHIPTNKWTQVAMTWSRSIRKLGLFTNGKRHYTVKVQGNSVLDFKNSGRLFYDIGLRKDTGGTIQECLSDLVIYNRKLYESEIKWELYENHDLEKFT